MSLILIISNLLLITNLISLPITQNFYFETNNLNTDEMFFNIKSEKSSTPDFPLKKRSDSLGVKVSAQSVLVKDFNTDKILWSKNKDEIKSIASISKLMTAMVILDLEEINLEQEIKIEKIDINGDFNKLKIYNWETIKFIDLLKISLITSSNTGIKILIKNTGLNEEEFVEKMNQKAKYLNLENTKFADPTGLDKDNVSTAWELIKMTKKAFSYPEIAQATSQKNYSFQTINSHRLVNVQNTNDLIGGYLNIEAGKTGYIEEAGYCLISKVGYKEQGPILVVVLGSESHYQRFSDLKNVSTWTFNNYTWK